MLGGTRICANALAVLGIALVAGCGPLSGAGDPAERYKTDCEIVSAEIDDSLAGFTDAVAAKEPRQRRLNWTVEDLPDGSQVRRFAALPNDQRTAWEDDANEAFTDHIGSAFARSWPLTTDADLTDVLRDFSREVNTTPNYEAFTAMCPDVQADIDATFAEYQDLIDERSQPFDELFER